MKKNEREKLAAAKAKAKKSAEEKATKKRVLGNTGPFGFRENTLAHQFCLAISEKPQSMKEIIEAKWNTQRANYYGYVPAMVKAGTLRKTAEGKMYIVGSPADPDAKTKKVAVKSKKKK